MKMIAPNIASPTMKPRPEATRKTDERKSPSGMIGSAARRSCSTNAVSSASAASARPTVNGDPHANWLPPRLVSRIKLLTPPVSRPAPRKSIACRCEGVCRWSRKTTTRTAAIPIGMLM